MGDNPGTKKREARARTHSNRFSRNNAIAKTAERNEGSFLGKAANRVVGVAATMAAELNKPNSSGRNDARMIRHGIKAAKIKKARKQ
jgi:hypothetical protein